MYTLSCGNRVDLDQDDNDNDDLEQSESDTVGQSVHVEMTQHASVETGPDQERRALARRVNVELEQSELSSWVTVRVC